MQADWIERMDRCTDSAITSMRAQIPTIPENSERALDLQITSPQLRRLFEDWQSWTKGRLFPGRGDFDPLTIKYMLARVNLLDVFYDPLRFRWRLHGTEVVRYVGRDLTGKFSDQDGNVEFRQRVTPSTGK